MIECETCGEHFEPNANRTGCVGCAPGQYSDDDSVCKNCDIGQYNKEQGQNVCKDCDIGQYQMLGGQYECEVIPDGIYIDVGYRLRTCNRGQQPNDKRTGCVNCTLGRYSDDNGVCKNCPNGQIQSSLGQDGCKNCHFTEIPIADKSRCVDICNESYYYIHTKPFHMLTKTIPPRESEHCVQLQPLQYIDRWYEIKNCSREKGQQLNAQRTGCVRCAEGQYPDNSTTTDCLECPTGYSNRYSASCHRCPIGFLGTTSLGSSLCSPCDAGKYNGQQGQSSCESCGTGKYNGQQGQNSESSCKDCDTGKYNNQTTQTSCTSCDTGKYNVQQGQTSCTSCGTGQYNEEQGQTICKDCDTGKYNNQTTQTSCTSCGTGKYNGQQGQSSCTPCDTGKYNEEQRQTSCKDCVSGQYQNQTGQSSCTPCGTGKYNGQQGQNSESSCKDCDTGKYNGQPGQSSCTPCPAGKYSFSTLSSCTPCPAGKYNGQQGQLSCTQCGTGKYQIMTGQDSCVKCPIGSSQSEPGQDSCMNCGPGKHQSNQTCINCTPGKYNRKSGQISCKSCRTGKYNNQTNQTSCTSCDTGKYNGQYGKTNCTDCGTGKYQNEEGQYLCKSNVCICNDGRAAAPALGKICLKHNSTQCVGCQWNEYLDEDNCLVCPAGKYKLSGGSHCEKDITRNCCRDCPINQYSTDNGLGCFACQAGMFTTTKGSTKCISCDTQNWTHNDFKGKGQYAIIGGCSFCLQGKYYTGVYGYQPCTTCPNGYYENEISSDDCKLCDTGKYMPDSQSDFESDNNCSVVLEDEILIDNIRINEGTFLKNIPMRYRSYIREDPVSTWMDYCERWNGIGSGLNGCSNLTTPPQRIRAGPYPCVQTGDAVFCHTDLDYTMDKKIPDVSGHRNFTANGLITYKNFADLTDFQVGEQNLIYPFAFWCWTANNILKCDVKGVEQPISNDVVKFSLNNINGDLCYIHRNKTSKCENIFDGSLTAFTGPTYKDGSFRKGIELVKSYVSSGEKCENDKYNNQSACLAENSEKWDGTCSNPALLNKSECEVDKANFWSNVPNNNKCYRILNHLNEWKVDKPNATCIKGVWDFDTISTDDGDIRVDWRCVMPQSTEKSCLEEPINTWVDNTRCILNNEYYGTANARELYGRNNCNRTLNWVPQFQEVNDGTVPVEGVKQIESNGDFLSEWDTYYYLNPLTRTILESEQTDTSAASQTNTSAAKYETFKDDGTSIEKIENGCVQRYGNRTQCLVPNLEIEGTLMAAKNEHVCVLDMNDKLKCWFSGTFTPDHFIPTGYEEVVDVDIYKNMACGLFKFDKDYKISCWGDTGPLKTDWTFEEWCSGRANCNATKMSSKIYTMNNQTDYKSCSAHKHFYNGSTMPGIAMPSNTSCVDDLPVLKDNIQEYTLNNTGCMDPKSCNYNERYNFPARRRADAVPCWYPWDENYECRDSNGTQLIEQNPVYDEENGNYVFNPGTCINPDDDKDDNRWCDSKDEVWGCLDSAGCNFGGGLSADTVRKPMGYPCKVNSNCLSGKCSFCDGGFKCVASYNPSLCQKSVRNLEIVTRNAVPHFL